MNLIIWIICYVILIWFFARLFSMNSIDRRFDEYDDEL